ncbi:DNA polymerase III subunit delta' [Tianweitania populi]|uniref:DNA polymerase III subunit delta n=1 Tax=Tianweitania populi TaxID=1607949 RepID=A0A8J3GK02_9HYPH|nr:DNA polymerase III subunit delta' [Tianweitania populi]GHD09498.1 DNA polymerase III subunit delta' [Tianweitania populi]
MYERLAPLTHDSLDDIPEPSETLRLVGHHEAREMLRSAHAASKLHHAILLSGPQGIGKATLAFQFAAQLLGESMPGGFDVRDPAGALYRQIASGAHPGVLHLSRPYDDKTKKFRTVITADEIRRVSRFLSLRTHDGGYRVVIVDPADDMNRSAANALLKNLEEPPSKVLFILISHSPGRLLPTIRSRTQVIKFHPLGADELFEAMGSFAAALPNTAEERAELARRAGGSPRAAILLTLHGGLEIAQATDQLISGRSDDVAAAYKLADAVTGREAGMQFQLFNAYALERLSEAATTLGREGHAAAAARLADAWNDATRRVGETEAYNLDKKQHVMSMLQTLREQLAA